MTDSPPVVLVLGPSLSAVSGVTTHVRQLLTSDLRKAHSLVHFQVGSEGRNESAFGRLARLVTGPFRLGAAIVKHDAAIVHINCSLDAKAYWRDLPNMLAAKLCGAGVVFQKHGGHLERFARNRFFASFVRATLRVPDVVVVLSQAEEEQYCAFVPGQPVIAVPNGVDPAPYANAHRPVPAPDRIRVLYIGRLVESKGVGDTLAALALARDSGVYAEFVIAGSGPDEPRLREQVRILGLERQVHFAGAVAGDEKVRLISRADVLALPTRHAEGLPYSLLEAMAAGTVPIVTGAGSIGEVVTNGVHGLYVPPQDPTAIATALRRLHQDRSLLNAMRYACKERIASGYTLERLAFAFDSIYSAVLRGPARRPRAAALRP